MSIFASLFLLIFSGPIFAQAPQLLVGLAGIDVEPKIGIPLAGYGSKERRLPGIIDWRNKHPDSFLFRPSEGIHSPIRAKTMVLKKGDDILVFLSMDTIGLEHRFIKDLARRLKKHGIKERQIFATATHTHGGPGTLSRRLPLQVIAVDFFKKENYEHVLKKTIHSVEEALANLEPAELFKSFATIDNVQRNKWRRKDEEHFDKRASFLVARSQITQQWLGGLVNFSIHGGTMPVGLLHYSSDINGAIEHQLESLLAEKNVLSFRSPVFLFMNGAEGDVGSIGNRSVEMIDILAHRFIDQAASAFEPESLIPVAPEFSITKKRIHLGPPGLDLRCDVGLFKKLPVEVKLFLWPLLPARSVISQAQVGDITILSWPGEPSTQLGYDLQAMARELGASDPWVFSLANDYATYFTTRSEAKEMAYDSCSSLYGPRGSKRILRAHKKLLKKTLEKSI